MPLRLRRGAAERWLGRLGGLGWWRRRLLNGVLLTVAYDGRPFAGFAPQPAQRTVAGELLGALREIDPKIVEVRGVSRTDSGVHARDQRVAFDTEANLPMRGWALSTARHLPDEIAIVRAARVETGFIPRFANRGKRYRYLVLRSPVRDPFLAGRAWRTKGLASPEALERAAREATFAVGTHDFNAFRSSSDARQNTVRTIRALKVGVDPNDPRVIRFDVEGDGFLHNMVRILVGTLVEVGRGRIEPGAIARAIASKDRRDAGITAPPDGLYLERVVLADEGTDAWPPSDAENASAADDPSP